MQHVALVPAAGSGQRFGAALPKQYSHLAGVPMLRRTVAALLAFEPFTTVLVVVSPDDTLAALVLADLLAQQHQNESLLKPAPPRLHIAYVGGDSRARSVRNGLQALLGLGVAQTATVWVHDAARPAVDLMLLHRLARALQDCPSGAVLAVPVADTLKRGKALDNAASNQHCIDRTLPRDDVWQAQTPQCFPLAPLLAALGAAQDQNQAKPQSLSITDEASAMEAAGCHPALVRGSSHNFKVTTPEDAALMEAILTLHPTINEFALNKPAINKPSMPQLAIGEGMDVHALVAGRPLILGGVNIPHHKGLLGHSDADALLHAVTDALLGAAGMGDIGRLFPDTEAAYAGADSQILLKQAYAKVAAAGWLVANVDATIVAQAPKMAAHIPAMQANIAACLALSAQQVNVKAKTNEQLGWLGRQEGIEVRAVLMLQRV